MRKSPSGSDGFIGSEIMQISARLDGLHFPVDCGGSDSAAGSNPKSVLRLLGLQNSRLSAVARQQDAKTALRLAL